MKILHRALDENHLGKEHIRKEHSSHVSTVVTDDVTSFPIHNGFRQSNNYLEPLPSDVFFDNFTAEDARILQNIEFECKERILDESEIDMVNVSMFREKDFNSNEYPRLKISSKDFREITVRVVNNEIVRLRASKGGMRSFVKSVVSGHIEERRRIDNDSLQRRMKKSFDNLNENKTNARRKRPRQGEGLITEIISKVTPTFRHKTLDVQGEQSTKVLPDPHISMSDIRGTGKAKVSKVSAPPLISQPFYSWDPLQLGTSLGTVALNNYLKNISTKPQVFVGFQNEHEYSPHDVLQIFDTIRAKTYLPPRSSFLQKVVQLPKEEGGLLKYLKDVGLENVLSKAYELMCSQDANEGILYQREMQCMTAIACVEKLAFLENSTFRLDLQEDEIMQRSDQVQNSLSKWKIEALSRNPKDSESIEDDDTYEYCYEGDTDNEVDF
eukprot:CAMPEP_0116050044 /NCGR_PEP_ID=MMETSP0322-20121206/150_1 /TAXON_ID=163516 /ORGANISM="Leptocylindrus danicus var. apora, Strain B651" /LENGTH=439 /DNA_ID=CAMNT_0003532527 /DNA_START=12 /DNA_END=1332 /DNA_ORIENTATION=-